MARIKKEQVDEEVLEVDEFKINLQEEVENEVEVKPDKKEKVKKEFGTVTLVSKNKVFYDYNGQSRYKIGKFDVKIGDKLEV